MATGELDQGDIAICGDWIVGTYDEYRGAREIDGRGVIAVPGFIDTHVHIESSLVTPFEFERAVLPRGTTTAICDPREIDVLGQEGVRCFWTPRAPCMTLRGAAQLVRAGDESRRPPGLGSTRPTSCCAPIRQCSGSPR